MITYRNCDRRFPFLWEVANQPAARWNRQGEGPVQYLADTSNGAWAEFLRHEEITEETDLAGVSRALWAVDVDTGRVQPAELPHAVLVGGLASYAACQAEADRIRGASARGIEAPSAALSAGAAAGWRVCGGFQGGDPRDGKVFVLFGAQPQAEGWLIVDQGRPPVELLRSIRPL